MTTTRITDNDHAEDTTEQATKLLQSLAFLVNARCVACAAAICGHEALFSIALGFQDAPQCLACLSAALGQQPAELRDHLAQHFEHRACLRHAWEEAGRREGLGPVRYPACLWGDRAMRASRPAVQPEPSVNGEAVTNVWDAGDMGCGDLVLALRGRLHALPPGSVLTVTARDPAAPLDLPAWCRLTGHRLLRAEHPHYDIQRKES